MRMRLVPGENLHGLDPVPGCEYLVPGSLQTLSDGLDNHRGVVGEEYGSGRIIGSVPHRPRTGKRPQAARDRPKRPESHRTFSGSRLRIVQRIGDRFFERHRGAVLSFLHPKLVA